MANTVIEDLSAPGMTDVRRARLLLERDGHTCVLCRGDKVYADDRAGIAPMMGFIGAGVDLRGFSAADRIVGRAAALLFVLAGVREVYSAVMSKGGAEVLEAHGIAHSCTTLTERIINRTGTGICPMEQAVTGIDDPHAAYEAIAATLERLRAQAAGQGGAIGGAAGMDGAADGTAGKSSGNAHSQAVDDSGMSNAATGARGDAECKDRSATAAQEG